VLVLDADFRRWADAGREDLMDSRVEGHFGEYGLAVDHLGMCVHLEDRRCSIYELRPDTCRDFKIGCAQCLLAQRLAGR
jgi:Fe-S-cluster containining protein